MQQNLKTFEQTFNTSRIFESISIQGANAKNDVSDILKIDKSNEDGRNFYHKKIYSSCDSSDHSR